MQRCADCGHSNWSGVHFCTHCGKATAVSGSPLGSPTAVVAAVVLAVGLLAFLTIRPVAQPPPRAEALPPLAVQHDVVAAGEELARVAGNEAADSATAPLAAIDGGESAAALPAADGDIEHAVAQAEAAAPSLAGEPAAPSLVGEPAGLPASASNAEAVRPEAAAAQAALAPSPLEAAMQSGGKSTGAAATPGLDPALAAHDVIGTSSTELMVPAASRPGSSLELRAALALAGPERTREHVDAPGPDPRPPRAQPPPPTPSVAKRAALDSGRTHGAAAATRPRERNSWLAKLRREIEACDGNFVARILCVERAKMQHCSSANAWGKVTECPAAMPDLATFN